MTRTAERAADPVRPRHGHGKLAAAPLIRRCSPLVPSRCPPVRVKLLSERLLAFRDTQGKVGVIDEFCAHRECRCGSGATRSGCAALSRLEIRRHRPVRGVPSEPEESGFCKKIRLKSYPSIELGDVIWVYMGPTELKPPCPRSNGRRCRTRTGSSPSRTAIIFRPWRVASIPPTSRSCIATSCAVTAAYRPGAELTRETDARFEVVETSGGMVVGVRRPARTGSSTGYPVDHAFHTMIPPYGATLNGHAWVR
jgi:hypothetical protein